MALGQLTLRARGVIAESVGWLGTANVAGTSWSASPHREERMDRRCQVTLTRSLALATLSVL